MIKVVAVAYEGQGHCEPKMTLNIYCLSPYSFVDSIVIYVELIPFSSQGNYSFQ